jgi:hypothetical protein
VTSNLLRRRCRHFGRRFRSPGKSRQDGRQRVGAADLALGSLPVLLRWWLP